MGVISHYEIARRWLFSRPGMGTATAVDNERQRRRMIAEGDVLLSYGRHFPLARLLRTPRGKPRALLLNGDTWGGSRSMTRDHQADVRRLAQNVKESLGIPHVIVPQSVLDAAMIHSSTVQIVESTSDTWENKVDDYAVGTQPRGVGWDYVKQTLPGTHGWVNQETGVFYEWGWGEGKYTSERDLPGYPKPVYSYMLSTSLPPDEKKAILDEDRRKREAFEAQHVFYPRVEKNTGRRYVTPVFHRGPGDWTYVELDTGERVFRHTWKRHWLGESLIRAQATVSVNKRCPECVGTGRVPEYSFTREVRPTELLYGPLSRRNQEEFDRWYTAEDGTRTRNPFFPATNVSTTCLQCRGRRKISTTKREWGYYLSGFDENERADIGYHFTRVPGRPKSVAEAYENLVPATVKLARELGREVKRQGDVFFIRQDGLSTRDLTRAGGVRVKRGDSLTAQRDATWGGTRWVNEDCMLLGQNHEATQVCRVGDLTYARGIVRHRPERRRPDHAHLPLGYESWWLAVRNTAVSR